MVYDVVPECVCDELQLLVTQFEQFTGATYDPSLKLNFSNYLSRIKGIEIKPDDLHTLLGMCEGVDCSRFIRAFYVASRLWHVHDALVALRYKMQLMHLTPIRLILGL
ncbi:MAG: hypothetical protein IPP71_19895 [Bacteroidetes bacterium]|nr:hypothetical protein [Bacteroidota bacterium]